MAVRGPAPSMWHDPAALRVWTRQNPSTYWAGLIGQLEAAGQEWLAPHAHDIVAWCVPGITRLHYTLTTGDVTSKGSACRYGLERFEPRWHPLLAAAKQLRHGELPAVPVLAEVPRFMRMVLEDAERLGS